jgi:hypothetical protein
MVRVVNRVFLPVMGQVLTARHTRGMKGRGVGSVLLNNGQGGGSGGSYNSIDDYVDITNRNPFNAPRQSSGRGVSLERMNKKIESLMVKPLGSKKPKNINFSL